ncbi:MAG TPA: glutathione peroxidase [Polyangiaceae bacterium]|nr:glutathione peroxidase [Polyangiaceae bacterium]
MTIYDLQTKTLEGTPVSLERYRNQVSLIVNLASACGYTPQYAGLERLQRRFQERGFTVLGFPCNDFGAQESGSPEEIRTFCESRYEVTFPLFEKVHAKPGAGQSDLYGRLERAAGVAPAWNFGKYLVSRSGDVLEYFPSSVEPEDPKLIAAIERALSV